MGWAAVLGAVPAYVRDLEAHFGGMRDHPAVVLARGLRSRRGVSCDAPMSLAVHLEQVKAWELQVPLDPWPEGIDRRWRSDDVREFLSLVRGFVEEGKFQQFWAEHQSLYEKTAQRARVLVEKEGRLEWFDGFFGERPGARFRLVLGLVNGGNCYGARVGLGGGEELYCILGVWQTDGEGQPVFDREVLDTVVHEFGHSYVNPLVYARLRGNGALGAS